MMKFFLGLLVCMGILSDNWLGAQEPSFPALPAEILQNVDAQSRELWLRAQSAEADGKMGSAIDSYRQIGRRYGQSTLVPYALEQRGRLYLQQRRYQLAFGCFRTIIEKYPGYGRYSEVIGLEFETAHQLMQGKRQYFWGKIPGFRDRDSAIKFFEQVVTQAPYSEYAPQALMNIAYLGLRTKEPAIAIDALERVMDDYAHTHHAKEARLMLARVYRSMVHGPNYDQRATQEASNAYREFLLLYPDSERIPEAEAGLAEVKELLAASRLNVGNFYYNDRQNASAAKMYYAEAIGIAPESDAARKAECQLASIGAGKRGKGSPLDLILGRYRSPNHGEYVPRALLDQPAVGECRGPNAISVDADHPQAPMDRNSVGVCDSVVREELRDDLSAAGRPGDSGEINVMPPKIPPQLNFEEIAPMMRNNEHGDDFTAVKRETMPPTNSGAAGESLTRSPCMDPEQSLPRGEISEKSDPAPLGNPLSGRIQK